MHSGSNRAENKSTDNRNKKMRKCSECNGKMEERLARTPDRVAYRYFKCLKCGEEIVAMEQLHEVAEKYREMKRFKVKLNRWGMSLGLRIPKELVSRYKLKDKKEVVMIEESNGIMVCV